MSDILVKTIQIQNKLGLHARSAAKFVTLASKFKSNILVSKDDIETNGKSILGLLMLAAAQGTEITLKISGPDQDEAFAALKELIDNKFDEGE